MPNFVVQRVIYGIPYAEEIMAPTESAAVGRAQGGGGVAERANPTAVVVQPHAPQKVDPATGR